MEHIRTATEQFMRNLRHKGHAKADVGQALEQNLKSLLSKQEQLHIRRYTFKDTRVILHVDSSVWLFNLNLKKEKLLQQLNQNRQLETAVKEISLQLDIK
ncbi:MAG: DUF721 domain-containing protein [Candidatus Omnitrophica bacterium]|nr:DUF721 domain-containing protein [Candidatus Omnitrophota bacterium]MBU1871782.1 DUF721 domain-containing protein [Candidatus Omnitrophota bacterium]